VLTKSVVITISVMTFIPSRITFVPMI